MLSMSPLLGWNQVSVVCDYRDEMLDEGTDRRGDADILHLHRHSSQCVIITLNQQSHQQ